jgi:hypothetical protein
MKWALSHMALNKQLHTLPNPSQPSLSLLLIHSAFDQITALKNEHDEIEKEKKRV